MVPVAVGAFIAGTAEFVLEIEQLYALQGLDGYLNLTVGFRAGSGAAGGSNAGISGCGCFHPHCQRMTEWDECGSNLQILLLVEDWDVFD